MTEKDDRTISEFIQDLENSRKYLEHNYSELNARHTDYHLCFKENWTPQKFKEIIENYSHALNNYLASYVALIDHMETIKNTINKAGNHEIIAIYREKVAKSGLRHEQTFGRRLRVYLLHYRIPEIDVGHTGFTYERNASGGYDFAGFSMESSLGLSVKKLRQWNEWGAGRDYLNRVPRYQRRIELGSFTNTSGLIFDLHNSVIEFLNWFETLLIGLNKNS